MATTEEIQQWNGLTKRIKESVLKDSPKLRGFLDFMFAVRERKLPAKVIEYEHYGYAETDHRHDPANSRGQIFELRKRFEVYFQDNPKEEWRCDIPNDKREGYWLEFRREERTLTPCQLFWAPHMTHAEKVVVVCNTHQFFYDPTNNSMVRFFDVNVREKVDPKLDLKERHPDAYKESLEPNHFYLTAGEVMAYEALQKWFFRNCDGAWIQRRVSIDVLWRNLHDSCPIYFGRPGANMFIKQIMDSDAAKGFRYRFGERIGSVEIRNAQDDDRAAMSRFPETEKNVFGPLAGWREILGVVTRLPNPSGFGTVTIVAADHYTGVISQIISMLTRDERTAELFRKVGLQAKQLLPDRFEMLFCVAQNPGNISGQGHPELLLWNAPGTLSNV